MDCIDLHTHTRYSDGTSTVENSLRCAEALSLSLFSVADHNTVDAYDEIMKKRELFSGRILPATELNALIHGNVIDVLGYGIDISKMREMISKTYLSFHDKQVAEAAINVRSILGHGAKLGDDFIKRMLEEPDTLFDPYRENSRSALLAELRKYPENARFFKNRKDFETLDQNTFSRCYIYNASSPLYCDQSPLFPTLKGVIDIIHSCGGLAFLAHALVYTKDFIDNLDEVIAEGFDGLECYYGTFNAEQRAFLCEKCREHGIYMSGGSDFHGLDMRPKNLMGLSSGVKIPESLISDWKNQVANKLI